MKNTICACGAVMAILFSCTVALCTENTNNYINKLQSMEYKVRLDTLKVIERSAVNSPELFTYINKRLLDGYLFNSRSNNHIDEMAWFCKALASSGDNQYLDSLQTVVDNGENKKLQRHCQRSIDQFDYYVEMRKILNQPQIEGYSAEMSKHIHMLKSYNYRLMRYAVNYFSKSDETSEEVYDMVRDRLLGEMRTWYSWGEIKDHHKLDTLAYFCKCLGGSGYEKYKVDLQKVVDNNQHFKLTRHAKIAINSL